MTPRSKWIILAEQAMSSEHRIEAMQGDQRPSLRVANKRSRNGPRSKNRMLEMSYEEGEM
jgi:hypothetical protein